MQNSSQIDRAQKYSLKLIFFATGILLASLLNFYEFNGFSQLLILFGVLFVSLLFYFYQKNYLISEIFFSFFSSSLLKLIFIFLTGYFLALISSLSQDFYLRAKINSSIQQNTRAKFVGRIESAKKLFALPGQPEKQQIIVKERNYGKVYLELPDSFALAKGDLLSFSARVKSSYFDLKKKRPKSESYFSLKAKKLTYLLSEPLFQEIKIKEDLSLPKKALLFLRDKLLEPHRLFLDQRSFAIVENLFLGRSSTVSLPKDLIYQARALGLSHIFAASGLHLFLVGVFCFYLFDLLGFSHFYRAKIVFALFGVLIYASLAEWSASILRAWFFTSLFLLAKFFERRLNSLNCLSIFLASSLLLDPRIVADWGFQFSLLAFAGIILCYQKIFDFLQFWPVSLAKISSVTFSAQVFILPLQLFYFQQIPLYFLLANFAVGLLFSISLFLIILISLFSLIPLSALWQSLLSVFLSLSLNSIQEIVELIFSFKLADLKITSFSLLSLFLIYSVIFFALRFLNSFVFKNYAIAVLLLIIFLESHYFSAHKEQLEIKQLNQSIVLVRQRDLNILICSSPETSQNFREKSLERSLLKQKVRKIDLSLGDCPNFQSIYSERKLKFSEQTKNVLLEGELSFSFDRRFVLLDYQKFSALFQIKQEIGSLEKIQDPLNYTVFYQLFSAKPIRRNEKNPSLVAKFCLDFQAAQDFSDSPILCQKRRSNSKKVILRKNFLKFV